MVETIFSLPIDPDEFGVVLSPAQLRRLNFSALEYTTLRRAAVEYIKSYFPDQFNDFVSNNGIIMLIELFAYLSGNIGQRGDILAEENFLSTARSEDAVINHLALINQTIRRQTPAVVDIEVSLSGPIQSALNLDPGFQFNLTGADGNDVTYEIFRAPNDFVSKITIPPNKRGVIAFGIEGSFVTPIEIVSTGGLNQVVDLIDGNILDKPIFVDVTTGENVRRWTRVDNLERFSAQDEVYAVKFNADGALIIFGDNVAGKAPLAGQLITIQYRIGGGIRGRINSLVINDNRSVVPDAPFNSPVDVLFRNNNPSSGGRDKETIEQAKKRAPKEAATLGSATSGEDFAQLSSTFTHPIFGSVLKSVAVIRTGVETSQEDLVVAIRNAESTSDAIKILDANFINRNIVELYVLAEGPNNIPVLPSAGLRKGLTTFFENIKVLTDEVRVLPGAIKYVDVRANIQVSRSADAATVKETVNVVIDDFFNVENFDMGAPLYLSSLYEAIQLIPGVASVAIFNPADDIIPTRELANPVTFGIGTNELITLGKKELKFFFEKPR